MKLDRQSLKPLLKEIKENEFKIKEGYSVRLLGHAMMEHIGDTDPVLRDELIYEVLEYWVLNDVFTMGEIKKYLAIAFDEQHLFFKLGIEKDDSVFTRTFSLLFIAATLYKHNLRNFLSKEDILSYLNQTIQYLENEVDVRGFVEVKGWAHSVAHASDVLNQFANCNELESIHHQKILNTVAKKIANRDYTYIHEEDERAVTAVMTIITENQLSTDVLSTWINDLVSVGTLKEFPDDSIIHINVKHFLRSLYFRLINLGQYDELVYVLKDGLCNMNRFIKQ